MFNFKQWNVKGMIVIIFISIIVSWYLFSTSKVNTKGKDYLILDGVKYYVNFKELNKNIKDSYSLDVNSAISSEVIFKDKTYNKYDIYYDNEDKRVIIFYKFIDEDDENYKSVKYDLEQFKIFINKK